MEALVGTIVGALLTGLVGLIALLRGKRLERDHWLRDQRLQAYSQFLSRLSETVSAGLNWSGDTDPDSQEFRSALMKSMVPLVQCRGRVELLGPNEIAELADLAVKGAGEAWFSAVNLQESESAGEDAWAVITRFRKAAQDVIIR